VSVQAAPARTSGEALQASPGAGKLSGLRKAAVFLLALEESAASIVLRSLGDEDVERLTSAIARLGMVDQATVAAVLEEFQDLAQLHGVLLEGGIDQAIRLVEKSFPPGRSRRLIDLLEAHRPHLPFAFLSRAESAGLAALIEKEHAQTAAVVLAHMAPSKAADVLARLPPERSREVVQRIATLHGPHEEVIRQLEKGLRRHLEASTLAPTRGGMEAAAAILRAAGREGLGVLDGLRADAPELAEELSKRLFGFEDLARLDAPGLRRLLEEIDPRRLAAALKGAPSALRERMLENLPGMAGEQIRRELDLLGPVRFSEVEAARRAIVETALELEKGGRIYIERRGREENRLIY
jgi:flagellar motor switch protein FliG